MSTFKGVVAEFPQIRIDFFRNDPQQPPPLACFLTHVHSDHLAGLESLRSPFVYCSAATAKILLRLEKYPHRINFTKGILESRVQTYRHLKNILKPIPLETPTLIELKPGYEIRVTLIEANHCVGAVMFLIEGQDRAVLYTGDIRSESWWVSKIARDPVLAPYAMGVKTLDCIYLDTTFASKSHPYRKFPTKAEGLRELLTKIKSFPLSTVFYMEAWTFGYEDVWVALATYLKTQVHLDRWRWGLYKALSSSKPGEPLDHIPEAAALCGFQLGNHYVQGCLTSNTSARIHSCERSDPCEAVRQKADVVRLVPIIGRTKDGSDIHELGLGGGLGDLDQIHELEGIDAGDLPKLRELCLTSLKGLKDSKLVETFLSAISKIGGRQTALRLDADSTEGLSQSTEMTLDQLVGKLLSISKPRRQREAEKADWMSSSTPRRTTITFPYSRHSSYEELREIVAIFKPMDIWPCTVDEDKWNPETSIRALFGDLCSGDRFRHDELMMSGYLRCQTTQTRDNGQDPSQATTVSEQVSDDDRQYHTPQDRETDRAQHVRMNGKRSLSPELPTPRKYRMRDWAYYAAAGLHPDCSSWSDFGGLNCVKDGQRSDAEL